MKRFFVFAVAAVLMGALAFGAYTIITVSAQPAATPNPHQTEISVQEQSPPPVPKKTIRSTGIETAAVFNYQPDRKTFTEIATPFLKNHCLKCHGPDIQKSNFRVDQDLPNDFLKRPVTEKWSEVLNMLNAGDMPPKSEPRPPADDVQRVVEWIEKERLRAERARIDRTVVLRRLNREEYNNTIRDLTGIDFQLVDEFPEDPPAGGFDNNGGALTVSPLHLEVYLKTAKKILDRTIVTTARRPSGIKWRFEFEEDKMRTDHNRIRLDDGRNKRVMMTRYSHPDRDGLVFFRERGATCRIGYFSVPHPGLYTIRIRAAAVVPSAKLVAEAGPRILLRRQEERESKIADAAKRKESREAFNKWSRPYHLKYFAADRSYRYGYPRLKVSGYLGPLQRIHLETDVDAPLSAPKTYEVQAWFTPETAGLTISNEYRIPYSHISNGVGRHKDFPRPELAIDWVEIEGPVYDDWPPSSHKQILIDSPSKGRNEAAYARDVLANFMRCAFRRPLREGEVKAFVSLFQKVRRNSSSFEDAIKVPLTAVLASPHFLYLVEEEKGGIRKSVPLNDFELASRLSYFLWSSMPDESLFKLAGVGKLNAPPTLCAQVDRMLLDKKAGALVKNFAGQWLRLREVGANPPVTSLYWRYDRHLEVSMRGETEAFFEHILKNDRSALDFIRSDYVTINERLARFYDIPGVKGDHFRPVKVPQGVPRGGLVTQASILSVTSNGTRTSPVWRGVWILERMLGDPPPPPPPNAGDIPPNKSQGRDRMTVRQRLQLHRNNVQCARCHNKIDPLGFALENFDASGEWRDKEGYSAIDGNAQLPDGTKFVGVGGLQRELLKRQNQFLRCLAEKLYTYALGRKLGYADEPMIRDAVAYMKNHDCTLRSLMHHIVASDAFRTK